MSAIEVQSYLEKAADFIDAVKLLAGSVDHRASMALLAVHSAISYADALSKGLGIERLNATDHRTRSSELLKALNQAKYKDIQGLRHLDSLIGNKTRIAYRTDLVTEKLANEWRCTLSGSQVGQTKLAEH